MKRNIGAAAAALALLVAGCGGPAPSAPPAAAAAPPALCLPPTSATPPALGAAAGEPEGDEAPESCGDAAADLPTLSPALPGRSPLGRSPNGAPSLGSVARASHNDLAELEEHRAQAARAALREFFAIEAHRGGLSEEEALERFLRIPPHRSFFSEPGELPDPAEAGDRAGRDEGAAPAWPAPGAPAAEPERGPSGAGWVRI